MKIMFISDIHGSAKFLKQALERYREESPNSLVLLGDLLYHGPRNPLPEGHDPQACVDMLNELAGNVIAVRGNCEAEVDQMVLNFPVMGDYAGLTLSGRRIFATHGHLYTMDSLPHLEKGDIFIQGHTHIPVAQKVGDVYFLNPGSISLPKEGAPHTYGILDERGFKIKTLAGDVFKEIIF